MGVIVSVLTSPVTVITEVIGVGVHVEIVDGVLSVDDVVVVDECVERMMGVFGASGVTGIGTCFVVGFANVANIVVVSGVVEGV